MSNAHSYTIAFKRLLIYSVLRLIYRNLSRISEPILSYAAVCQIALILKFEVSIKRAMLREFYVRQETIAAITIFNVEIIQPCGYAPALVCALYHCDFCLTRAR